MSAMSGSDHSYIADRMEALDDEIRELGFALEAEAEDQRLSDAAFAEGARLHAQFKADRAALAQEISR